MKLPNKWLKNTIETFVKTDVDCYSKYTFTLMRRYIGLWGLKEEKLIQESFCDYRSKTAEQIQKLECYQRIWNYKNAIDKAINGNSPDLRKQALDALASVDMNEKDRFISDYLQSLEKKST